MHPGIFFIVAFAVLALAGIKGEQAWQRRR